jgi:hypothetical protein
MALLSKIRAVLTLNNDDFKRGLKDSEKQTQSFGKAIGKIGGAIAGAFAVREVIMFGAEMVKLNTTARNVDATFEKLGISFESLQTATDFGIAEVRLKQMAIQARNLGVNVNQLATYFKFATIRAAETGESIDYLVNSLVIGVGRQSRLVLDNLGIGLRELNEEIEKTGDFAEAANNIIVRSLEESTIKVEDAVDAVTQLQVVWEDLQKAVAESKFTEDTAEATSDIVWLSRKLLELNAATSYLDAVYEGFDYVTRLGIIPFVTEFRTLLDLVGLGRNVFIAAGDDAKNLVEEWGKLPDALMITAGGTFTIGSIIKQTDDELKAFNNTLIATKPLVDSFWEPFISDTTKTAAGGISPLIGLGAAIDFVKEFGYQGELLDEDLLKLAETFLKLGRNIAFAGDEMAKTGGKFKKSETDISEVSSTLSSIASSAIQGSMSVLADALEGKDVLASFGNFIGQLGRMMMAYGAMMIAKEVLEELASKPGPQAIPAGIALIAAGAAAVAMSGAI